MTDHRILILKDGKLFKGKMEIPFKIEQELNRLINENYVIEAQPEKHT